MYFSFFTSDRFGVDVIGHDTRYALSGFKHFLNDCGYLFGSIFGPRAIVQDRVHGRTVIYVPFDLASLKDYLNCYPFSDDIVFQSYSLPLTDPIQIMICNYVRKHYDDPALYENISKALDCDLHDFCLE